MTAVRHASIALIAILVMMAAPSALSRIVIVRSYNTFDVPAPIVARASHTVRALLSTVEIDARWRDCRVVNRPRAEADPCMDPVAPNEIVVRLVGGVLSLPGPDASLGYAYVDPITRTGSLATVYADRVAELASALAMDRGTILGRAVAHEVGHLLIGTQTHADAGLMRGLWSARALVTNREADWFFGAEDGAGMRSGLDARLVTLARK